MTFGHNDSAERILILAPVGRDAALATETLEQAGLPAVACAGISQLLEKLAEGAGALLLTEEALAAAVEPLKEVLSAQPPWSDLPLILLVGNQRQRFDYTKLLRRLEGNITVLQRPVSAASLVTVAQTALRARRRQYTTRELLDQLNDKNERLALEVAEREQAQASLKQLADSLEQKVVERTAELRASEARFRKIFEEGPLGMGIVDKTYRLVQANARLCQMLGYSEAELLGRSPFEFTHPADKETDQALADQVYRGLISDYQLEKRFITKSGKTIWVMLTATVIRAHEDGELFGLGMLEDITEQKRIEQERAILLAETSRQRDQLRSLSARLAEVQERERQRLVRELHDRVGQTLTALNFNLGFVRSQIPDDLPAAAVLQSRLTQAVELVAEATERIRDVMAELRPPLLDESGLVDALEWYASRFETWSGLAVFVNADRISPRLTATIENALFRITQEALNNVVKHAQARQVTLSLHANDQTIRLVIADDGCGFDAAAHLTSGKDSWGMQTMAERAEMVNGKCRIESRPGRGTQVVVEAPHVGRAEIAPHSLEA